MLTLLEIMILNRIVNDCFQDDSTPVNYHIWAQGIAETKAEGGVLASLIKKDFVDFCDQGNKRENTLSITQSGYDALLAAIGVTNPEIK